MMPTTEPPTGETAGEPTVQDRVPYADPALVSRTVLSREGFG